MRATFRHIQFLKTAVETGSITQTAKELNVSQPAVSHALRELEAQLGLTLFVRSAGRIRPTAEALALREDADRVLGAAAGFAIHAEELRTQAGGNIDVAAIPVLSLATMPAAVGLLKAEMPFSSIAIRSMTTDDVIKQVVTERAHLGFVARPVQEAGVSLEPLMETDFCCFLPEGHPLTTREFVRNEDLDHETIIAIGTVNPPGIAFRPDGNDHRRAITVETNNAFTAAEMVRRGVGVAVIDPLPLCDYPAEGIAVRPFVPSFSLTVSAVHSLQRPHSKLERAFVEKVRSILHNYADILNERGIFARKR
ncbi:LysR family transcriptional regulator [Acuticoccus mangrovi]|uniref:LysR family transcriptional regulator n=1 Tax=Acuticoccus mangrovi TaxID=2796142 RepID=A0A934IN74_9HYPH|nr:LysR substrate-binding domain-containing protein [Acuticoccus mangrovi]MBJ3775551.1 LysR family transcriptional regulator [Acuticoccus mangrovi]